MKWYRPNVTALLTLAVTVGFFMRLIDPQAFFGFATGLVVWWLKSRDDEKKNGELPTSRYYQRAHKEAK